MTIRRGTKWDIGRADGVLIGRGAGEPTGAIDIVETAAMHTVYNVPVLCEQPDSPIIDHHARRMA